MKKLVFTISTIFLFCATNLIYAQDVKETTDIKEVKVRYCNDPLSPDAKSLFLDAKNGEKSVVCIDFINTANKKANIGINFVDGAITDDTDQKKACLPEGVKTNFGQYVTNYPETLEIAPNSAKRVFVDLLYTGGFAGASYGCLTYHALGQTGTENINGTMFNIFSRVGSFIDAFVVGNFKIKLITSPIESEFYHNISTNNNFIIYREGSWKDGFWKSSFWNYKAKLNITNTGNVAVTGNIHISATTWKVISTTTSITDQVFLPQQTRSFEVDIPWYMARLLGGYTDVSVHADYEAIYLGSYAKIAPHQTFDLTDSTHVLFFPWIILILIGYLVGKWYFQSGDIKNHPIKSQKKVQNRSVQPTISKVKKTLPTTKKSNSPRTRKVIKKDNQ